MQATIIRVVKNSNYTCINNEFLINKNLSLKAKGLLAVALSLPGEWDYSINGLVSILKEKRDSVKSTLEELKENNYLQVNKKKNEKGLFIYEYIFKESNKINSSSRAENPELDNPGVDNPIQINTNNKVLKNKIDVEKNINSVFETDQAEWLEIVNEFLAYRKSEHKFSYKSDISFRTFLKKLKDDSQDDINTARKLITDSIANGWKGVFKQKYNQKEGNNNVIW